MENPNTLSTPGSRLRWARENRSLFATASEAARAHGWAISTYLGHENGDRVPSIETAKRYATAYRVTWGWILEGGSLPDDGSLAPKIIPSMLPILGEVAAGVWIEPDAMPIMNEFQQVPIAPDPRFPDTPQYGYIVRGNSSDMIAEPGDVLHCVDLGKHHRRTPEEHDVVIIQRSRPNGQTETTAKLYNWERGNIVLSPLSSDPKWKGLTLKDENPLPNGDRIGIEAIVIGLYRPLWRRKGR